MFSDAQHHITREISIQYEWSSLRDVITHVSVTGSRLLTGGESIQIWAFSQEHHEETAGGSKTVHFDVGGVDDDHKDDKEEGENLNPIEEIETIWVCVWRCK